MNSKIRSAFESVRNPKVMIKYSWDEVCQGYEPKEGDAFSDGGTFTKARQLTEALTFFTEGHKAAKPKWTLCSDELPPLNNVIWLKTESGLSNCPYMREEGDNYFSFLTDRTRKINNAISWAPCKPPEAG